MKKGSNKGGISEESNKSSAAADIHGSGDDSRLQQWKDNNYEDSRLQIDTDLYTLLAEVERAACISLPLSCICAVFGSAPALNTF